MSFPFRFQAMKLQQVILRGGRRDTLSRALRTCRVSNIEPTVCQPGLSCIYQLGLSEVSSNIDVPLKKRESGALYLQLGTLRTHLQLFTRYWSEIRAKISDHLHLDVSNRLILAEICTSNTQSTRFPRSVNLFVHRISLKVQQ